MRDYSDYPLKEQEARRNVDRVRGYIENLPAHIYNADPDKWQAQLAAVEAELDRLIDERYDAALARVDSVMGVEPIKQGQYDDLAETMTKAENGITE